MHVVIMRRSIRPGSILSHMNQFKYPSVPCTRILKVTPGACVVDTLHVPNVAMPDLDIRNIELCKKKKKKKIN